MSLLRRRGVGAALRRGGPPPPGPVGDVTVAVTGTVATGNGTLSVDIPAHTAGDLLLLRATESQGIEIATPAGWDLVRRGNVTTSGVAVFSKTGDGSAGTVDVVLGNRGGAAQVGAYAGTEGTPAAVTSTIVQDTLFGDPLTLATGAVNVADGDLLACLWQRGRSGVVEPNWTLPAGMTSRAVGVNGLSTARNWYLFADESPAAASGVTRSSLHDLTIVAETAGHGCIAVVLRSGG